MKHFVRFFPAIALIATGCIGFLLKMDEETWRKLLDGGLVLGAVIYVLLSLEDKE